MDLGSLGDHPLDPVKHGGCVCRIRCNHCDSYRSPPVEVVVAHLSRAQLEATTQLSDDGANDGTLLLQGVDVAQKNVEFDGTDPHVVTPSIAPPSSASMRTRAVFAGECTRAAWVTTNEGGSSPAHPAQYTELVEQLLVSLLTLGVGAWVGGFVTVFVVSRSSKAALAAPARVALFRELGRRYAVVAAVAMVLILVPATVLTIFEPSTAVVSTFAVTVALIAASIPAIAQARRMGTLRREALAAPDDAVKASAVLRGSRRAAVLRGTLAAGSLVLVVLAVVLNLPT